jgi:protein O-GlcNAc transferase
MESSNQVALVQIHDLIRQERFEEASVLCLGLIERAPEWSRAWFSLGVIRLSQRRLVDAEAALRAAAAREPLHAGSWGNLSVTLRELRRSAEAEECARRAVELEGGNALYWNYLGNARFSQGRWREAVHAYRQSISRNANDAQPWSNLGAAEQKAGNLQAALEAYERCLALDPANTAALTNYAYLLNDRAQPAQALAVLEQVLARDAQMPAAWVARGTAFRMLGDELQAEAAYRRALELNPERRETRFNLALLVSLRSPSEAEAVLRPLLEGAREWGSAWALYGGILQSKGQCAEGIHALQRALRLEPTHVIHSKLLTGLQYLPDVTPELLLDAHRQWDRDYCQNLVADSPLALPANHARPPLRIGFVTKDFGRHPTGFMVLRAIECLDKRRCIVICYADRIGEDEYTARFRASADVWRTTLALTPKELAQQIRADEIDILVDLMGHTGNRLLTFAQRPAPLQVTWFGYVGTTGLAAMDFLLADRFHVREGEEQFYTEKILRLPNGYACYGPPADAPEVGPLPAIANGCVTFGCFNNPAKYAPRIVGAWAEILRRMPSSRLLLKYDGLDDAETQNRLRQEFATAGVEPGRILLEGRAPHRELLASYSRVDLALDTQPYSGGVTTCEALWMGVPVITFPGQTFAGRHATSHLTNAGYSQFVAADLPGYIDLAVHWASRLDELAAIRSQMREQVCRSPLCDAPRFARDLLDVLEQAWRTKTQ